MVINDYVKQWCDEKYDVRKELFHLENAHYVIEREWATVGIINAIVSFIAFIVSFINVDGNGFVSLVAAFANAGIASLCVLFYGIRRCNANSSDTGLVFGVMLAVFLFIFKSDFGWFLNLTIAVPLAFVSIYMSIICPLRAINHKRKFKKQIEEEEMEEESNSKNKYKDWESGYKAYRYGLPEAEIKTDDPAMSQARAMFDGYTDDLNSLKTQYRSLAKKYHPDRGGDTHLFQCIIAVYEEYKNKLS